MNNVLRTDPPGWLRAVSVVLLLWNLLGVFAYVVNVTTNEAALAENYSAEQIAILTSIPPWVTGAFAVAVFSGTLGALGLLMRKQWARIMFLLSLAAVIVQDIWAFLASGWLAVAPAADLILDAAILIICIYQVWLANRGIKRGWLR